MSEAHFSQTWLVYRDRAIPRDIDPEQLRQLRISFYAGASSVLALFRAMSDPTIPDKIGAKMLHGVRTEVDEFIDRVKADKRASEGAPPAPPTEH
jgi:hypothetical protein